MRTIVILWAAAGLTGCTDMDISKMCEQTSTPLEPGEPSSLGFSANEVLDAVKDLVIETSWTTGETTTWSFVASADGQPSEVVRDADYESCQAGTYVLVPIQLSLSDDQWHAEGSMVLEASGTALEDIRFFWEGSTLPVLQAPADLHESVANSRDTCLGQPGEEQLFAFSNDLPDSLASGNLSYHVSYDGCIGGKIGGPFVSSEAL